MICITKLYPYLCPFHSPQQRLPYQTRLLPGKDQHLQPGQLLHQRQHLAHLARHPAGHIGGLRAAQGRKHFANIFRGNFGKINRKFEYWPSRRDGEDKSSTPPARSPPAAAGRDAGCRARCANNSSVERIVPPRTVSKITSPCTTGSSPASSAAHRGAISQAATCPSQAVTLAEGGKATAGSPASCNASTTSRLRAWPHPAIPRQNRATARGCARPGGCRTAGQAHAQTSRCRARAASAAPGWPAWPRRSPAPAARSTSGRGRAGHGFIGDQRAAEFEEDGLLLRTSSWNHRHITASFKII